MRITKTPRGFAVGEFRDINGDECSIQESSRAGDYCLWLGLEKGTHIEGCCMARMHLNRKLAKMLIQKLQVFVDTGYLPRRKKPAKKQQAAPAVRRKGK